MILIPSKEWAESEGWTVDQHCYPWVAYKGERFAPDAIRHVLTDREVELLTALIDVLDADVERNEAGELTPEGWEAHNRASALVDKLTGES